MKSMRRVQEHTMRAKSLLSMALLSWLAIGQLPAVAQSASGYFLSQQSPDQGPFQMKVSELGMRLDGKELTIIVHPTQGTASMFNRTQRTWCQLSDKSLLNRYGSKAVYGQIKAGGKTTMNGHQVTQYYAQAYEKNTQKPLWVLEFFAAKDLQLPKRIEDDCSEMMGLPSGYGWPLRVVHYSHYQTPQQTSQIVLQTMDCRPIATTAADFSPPPGYQQVKSEVTVFTGESEQDVDDIINELKKSKNTSPHRSN